MFYLLPLYLIHYIWWDNPQGEPSLAAGLDVAQEHEEGGEKTEWQVRVGYFFSGQKVKVEEQNLQKAVPSYSVFFYVADNAFSAVDQLCRGRFPFWVFWKYLQTAANSDSCFPSCNIGELVQITLDSFASMPLVLFWWQTDEPDMSCIVEDCCSRWLLQVVSRARECVMSTVQPVKLMRFFK